MHPRVACLRPAAVLWGLFVLPLARSVAAEVSRMARVSVSRVVVVAWCVCRDTDTFLGGSLHSQAQAASCVYGCSEPVDSELVRWL